MGLFNINRAPFESGEAAAVEAAQEKWGYDKTVANIGPLAVKVEVQNLDSTESSSVDVAQQLKRVEEYANQTVSEQRSDATLEGIAIDDLALAAAESHDLHQ